jgi:hypothetical protein
LGLKITLVYEEEIPELSSENKKETEENQGLV